MAIKMKLGAELINVMVYATGSVASVWYATAVAFSCIAHIQSKALSKVPRKLWGREKAFLLSNETIKRIF